MIGYANGWALNATFAALVRIDIVEFASGVGVGFDVDFDFGADHAGYVAYVVVDFVVDSDSGERFEIGFDFGSGFGFEAVSTDFEVANFVAVGLEVVEV